MSSAIHGQFSRSVLLQMPKISDCKNEFRKSCHLLQGKLLGKTKHAMENFLSCVTAVYQSLSSFEDSCLLLILENSSCWLL